MPTDKDKTPQSEPAPVQGTKAKPEPKAAATPKAKPAGALAAVGREACRLHKLEQVWVTADGQCFPVEGDAKAHAANLKSKELLKVTAP